MEIGELFQFATHEFIPADIFHKIGMYTLVYSIINSRTYTQQHNLVGQNHQPTMILFRSYVHTYTRLCHKHSTLAQSDPIQSIQIRILCSARTYRIATILFSTNNSDYNMCVRCSMLLFNIQQLLKIHSEKGNKYNIALV